MIQSELQACGKTERLPTTVLRVHVCTFPSCLLWKVAFAAFSVRERGRRKDGKTSCASRTWLPCFLSVFFPSALCTGMSKGYVNVAATAIAAVVPGWGGGRWAPVLGGGRGAQLCWGSVGTSGSGTAPSCEAGCPGLCGPGRRRRRRRRRGAGREGRTAPTGRRAPSEWGPSAGPRGGTAGTRSGRVRAARPSANSPDSWKRERQDFPSSTEI